MPLPPSAHSDHVPFQPAPLLRARIWDLPTRLFHWLLFISVVSLLVTGILGKMELHFRLGYVVLALLTFRILWGFVGGHWSRFRTFIYAPHSLLAYLRGRAHPDHLIGHTPLGALSVFALLTILVLQVISGLLADNEIDAAGPLTRFVSGSLVSQATRWHKTFGQWLVIGLASLHVLAVLYYALIKRHQLVKAMVTGDKSTPQTPISSRDDATSRLLALVLMALCAGLAYWIASLRL